MWTALLLICTTTLGYYVGGHFSVYGEFHPYLGAALGFFIGLLFRFIGIGEGIGDAFDGSGGSGGSGDF